MILVLTQLLLWVRTFFFTRFLWDYELFWGTGREPELLLAQIQVFGFWACFACNSMSYWAFLTKFAVSGCQYQVLSTDTFYSAFSCTRKDKCQLHHFFWPEKEPFKFCGQRFWDNAVPSNSLGGPFRTHLLHFFVRCGISPFTWWGAFLLFVTHHVRADNHQATEPSGLNSTHKSHLASRHHNACKKERIEFFFF